MERLFPQRPKQTRYRIKFLTRLTLRERSLQPTAHSSGLQQTETNCSSRFVINASRWRARDPIASLSSIRTSNCSCWNSDGIITPSSKHFTDRVGLRMIGTPDSERFNIRKNG